MKEPVYIYVHGFNSSPASIKAQIFKREIAQRSGARVEVPELSNWPAEAIQTLRQRIEQYPQQSIVLIGSSLGGYYSTWLTEHYDNVRAILVNPAVRPYALLEEWLGENENLYTHERYELTREHLQQLIELDCAALRDPARYLLLTQTGDETLDYREAVDKFAASPQFVQPGGSHGFDRFEDLIPAIEAFAAGRIELPAATPLPLSSR